MNQKVTKWINILFLILIGIICIGGLFFNRSQIDRVPMAFLLIGTSICLILISFAYFYYQKKLINKKIKHSLEIKLIIVISSILLIVLLLFGILLRNFGDEDMDHWNYGEWDLRIVVGYVNTYVDGQSFDSLKTHEYVDYTKLYHNIDGVVGLLIPVYKVFRLFGCRDFLIPGIITNVLMIFLSILLEYYIIRKLYDNKRSIFFLGLTILFSPLFLYASIFYSDTLSIPFILGIISLYLYSQKNHSKPKSLLLYILIGVLTALGCLIKMTVLLITIAIFIDLFLSKKEKLSLFLIPVFSILTLFLIKNIYIRAIFPFERESSQIPSTHFIMMGLKEKQKSDFDSGVSPLTVYGVFDIYDVHYTLFEKENYQCWITNGYYSEMNRSTISYKKKQKNNIQKIKMRLEEKNFFEWVQFFSFKHIQTWADGSFYAPAKLEIGYQDRNILGEFVRLDGKYFYFYYYLSHFIHMSLIVLIFFGAIASIKEGHSKLRFIKLSICMLMGLLLIWETRSRYIVNYILVLYILILPGLDFLFTKYQHIKKQ